MNIAAAGPLLCVWLNRRGASQASHQVGGKLAWNCYWLLCWGVVFGFFTGWVAYAAGDHRLVQTLPFFRSKVLWGMAEVATSLVWTWGYWAWFKWARPARSLARFFHASLAVLTATNLLYHFPLLMTVLRLAANGEIDVHSPVDSAGYRRLAFSEEVLSHSAHVWIASFAVAGVYTMGLAAWSDQEGDSKQTSGLWKRVWGYVPVLGAIGCCRQPTQSPRWSVVTFGARVGLAATVLQLVSGFWLLLAVPAAQQRLMFGGDALSALLLLGSVLAAFHLLQIFGALSFGETEEKLPRRGVAVMALTVVLMTAVLWRIS